MHKKLVTGFLTSAAMMVVFASTFGGNVWAGRARNCSQDCEQFTSGVQLRECRKVCRSCPIAQDICETDDGIVCCSSATPYCDEGICSACDYNDPNRTYVGYSPEECSILRWGCLEGEEGFVDDCGCGCQR